MINTHQLNELAKRLLSSLPSGLAELPKEIEKNFYSILQTGFNKMELVTREEFDAQTKVLQRTREKLEALEKRVHELEAKCP